MASDDTDRDARPQEIFALLGAFPPRRKPFPRNKNLGKAPALCHATEKFYARNGNIVRIQIFYKKNNYHVGYK